MLDSIYTIPIKDVFEPKDDCPICRLRDTLETRCIDYILGAAMMEPDIRIMTNKQGFCLSHYNIMLGKRRMLGMGLMMESHLAEVKKRLDGPIVLGNKRAAALASLSELEGDCYVCTRIEKNLNAMIATAVYLFESDGQFKKKFSRVPYFCLPHYRAMLDYSSKKMNKRAYAELYDAAYEIEDKYIQSLTGDVSWFCKKFDYRYDEEPWYNSKDSVQRAIKFLSGDPKDET